LNGFSFFVSRLWLQHLRILFWRNPRDFDPNLASGVRAEGPVTSVCVWGGVCVNVLCACVLCGCVRDRASIAIFKTFTMPSCLSLRVVYSIHSTHHWSHGAWDETAFCLTLPMPCSNGTVSSGRARQGQQGSNGDSICALNCPLFGYICRFSFASTCE
jgi:hypothetical protein